MSMRAVHTETTEDGWERVCDTRVQKLTDGSPVVEPCGELAFAREHPDGEDYCFFHLLEMQRQRQIPVAIVAVNVETES